MREKGVASNLSNRFVITPRPIHITSSLKRHDIRRFFFKKSSPVSHNLNLKANIIMLPAIIYILRYCVQSKLPNVIICNTIIFFFYNSLCAFSTACSIGRARDSESRGRWFVCCLFISVSIQLINTYQNTCTSTGLRPTLDVLFCHRS